jgi:hypothetical protein
VAALGALANLEVTLLNGAMPVTFSATGALAGQVTSGSAGFYQVAHAGSIIPWLGDAMRLDLPLSSFMLSPGDVLLAVGVVVVIASAMRESDDFGQENATK